MKRSVIGISAAWACSLSVAIPCMAAGATASRDKATTIGSFNGTNGDAPFAGVVDLDGAYFGTTCTGGKDDQGTIYRMTPAGTVKIMHSFKGLEGRLSHSTLLLASDGAFYGTTAAGGANGQGTVFRITLAGKFTLLHTFDGADGADSEGGLVQARDGDLYGTTSAGGTAGNGTVFRVTLAGDFAKIADFPDPADSAPVGVGPTGPLLEGDDGLLYGTAGYGGAFGSGTIFNVSTSGVLSDVHDFDGEDGSDPYGGLAYSADRGRMVGITMAGPVGPTIFQVEGTTLTRIHDFDTSASPGALVLGADGLTFYGLLSANFTTKGNVFALSPSGKVRNIAIVERGNPVFAAPTVEPDGTLLAVTIDGGRRSEGSVVHVTGFPRFDRQRRFAAPGNP